MKLSIKKVIRYRYWNDHDVEFYTSKRTNTTTSGGVYSKYVLRQSYSDTCEGECFSKNVTAKLEYRNKKGHNTWALLGEFANLSANCDKLHWAKIGLKPQTVVHHVLGIAL